METVVDIPLKNGEHYLIPFIPIDPEFVDGEKPRVITLVAKELLTWKLILGIDKQIFYTDIKYSPDEKVLDIGIYQLSQLMEYLNQYAPSGYRFDLPTELDWVQAYKMGIIKKEISSFYAELTSTWDYEHCTPENSAGSGVSYIALNIDEKSKDGYGKSSVSEVYGKWRFSLGIRFVLKKYPPQSPSSILRSAFYVANEVVQWLKKQVR